MSKKEVKDAAKAAEMQEQERRKAIADFNVNQMGKMWIDPDKIPTDDDIAAAKKDFEEFTKSLQEKHDFLIADKPNALRVAKFMMDVIDRAPWKGMYYVGILRFHAQMEDFIKDFDENNPVDLVLDYGAMQFAYIMFKDFGGTGIESANWMAENNEQFVPILDTLHEHNDWYEFQVRKSENLKQRWAAMEQGYFLTILEGNDEDTIDPSTVAGNDEGTETVSEETAQE